MKPSQQQTNSGPEMGSSQISLTSQMFEQPLSSVSIANNDEDEFYTITDEENSPQMFELTEEEAFKSKRI